MDKGINLKIQELKDNISNTINESKLAPGIVIMIIADFMGQVQTQNAQAIEIERKAIEEKEGVKDGEEIHKG